MPLHETLMPGTRSTTAEERRLEEDARRVANWKRWGPYLAERQWGTVREDYSANGDAWGSFTHDMARSRAYRWGEDGLLGICDRECRLCFAVALWNHKDPILKERLFGLSGPEGNHGEDVKEEYYYLDSTPTHSYMRGLYKYPQAEYPYALLVSENAKRTREQTECELQDTGVFDGGRYFDVLVEYAKASPEDILIRISIANRGPAAAPITVLPTLWARNSWVWGCTHEGCEMKPWIERGKAGGGSADGGASGGEVLAEHVTLGAFTYRCDAGPDGKAPELVFTENETNNQRLYGEPNSSPFVKDGFHEYVVRGEKAAVNAERGSKAAFVHRLHVGAGETVVLRARLTPRGEASAIPFGREFDEVFDRRKREADEFYESRIPPTLSAEQKKIARQAFAGLLWSKQFYHYVVESWLDGDPAMPPPPAGRGEIRNGDWRHLFNRDVISMPDKWEYPWYAAWDLAFHTIPFARIDPQFAKEQLVLFLREWYMHPSGQIPAYEWALGDVNPPVHAWAVWRVYKMTAPKGQRDRLFLARCFQKLLLNFTWWVNRKDPTGRNIFAGGFLGLDNIGVFDRSRPLPTGGHLEQADGTAWMAFYCGTMLSMAIELAKDSPEYEDLASKFFEHFVAITDAMNTLGGTGLWDEADGFYYDQIRMEKGAIPLRLRTMVGLVPMLAVEVLEEDTIERLGGFRKRMEWFLEHRRDLARHITYMEEGGAAVHGHRLLAIPSRERLVRLLGYMLNEKEFLSPYGLRSMSRVHERNPYVFRTGGEEFRAEYTPGESNVSIFGGNSNWRGPVWFPLNCLIIEALERYHHFYGDSLKVECPVGSGKMVTLREVASEIGQRLVNLFIAGRNGVRPCHGRDARYANDPNYKPLLLFHEYFHAESGKGLGASHQTGWTALVATILCSGICEQA
ncbi:MAG TPA: glucosidase [Phycisphaerales bacterium]|nr:glucosidase [Phycisphaerales bacterium]